MSSLKTNNFLFGIISNNWVFSRKIPENYSFWLYDFMLLYVTLHSFHKKLFDWVLSIFVAPLIEFAACSSRTCLEITISSDASMFRSIYWCKGHNSFIINIRTALAIDELCLQQNLLPETKLFLEEIET